MKWNEYLDKYKIKGEESITHTSISGGKWHISKKDLLKFYKKLDKYLEKHSECIVERLGDIHPFIIDIDLKYTNKIDKRQYTQETIEKILNVIWDHLSSNLKIENQSFDEIILMEKKTPYPCKSNSYESKDGIHIVFPKIILKNITYKEIISEIKESKLIHTILDETCELSPDNDPDSILDASFTSWLPYGCSKEDEEPYLITEIYNIDDEGKPFIVEEKDEKYSNTLEMMKYMSMCYHPTESIKYKTEFEDKIKNKLKHMPSNQSNGMVNSKKARRKKKQYYIDNNQVINRYEHVEKQELDLIKGLVGCLDNKRADDYGTWIQVGLCLKNINEDLLDSWKEFSSQCPSYSETDCNKKWDTIRENHNGSSLGIGSLYYWAKNDNNQKYYQLMKESLRGKIEKSINFGPDAHHLIGLVIADYYKNQFISVDINDDWYYFNGVRWKKTLKGNELKRRIHDDIYNIYHEYGVEYKSKRDTEEEGTTLYQVYSDNHDKCLSFQKKLLQENYVCTVINALKHMFYKENVMEEFDMNVDLVGFENGIYDLNECVFREGRPEDYVTMSNKMILPIDPEWEPGDDLPIPEAPIPLDQLIEKVRMIDDYEEIEDEMMLFMEQVIPDPVLREYVYRFIAKCLSGKNKEEGFYIWTGSGGNGKSKLVELISLCFGDYYCNLPIALLTQKRKASGAASPELARTKGKRFVVMQEPGTKEKLNIGEMKEITGNDKIQARGLFKEPFEFRPQFKLVMMTNELPIIESDDDGTWRRLEAVPFISRFVEKDKVDESQNKYLRNMSLQEDIPDWMIPFILKLLIECRSYYKEGIHIPKAVKDRTRQYRNDNDIIGQFISDCCQEVDNITIGDYTYAPTEFTSIYTPFVDWCDEEEIKNRPDRQTVRESLKKWQEKSKYGMRISKSKEDRCRNGTHQMPKFNLETI